jgi:hypothetical protein
LCLHDILVVLLLCIVGAMVLAVGCLLVGLLSLWCHIVVNATGRFRRLMVEATGAMEWAFAVEVEVAMGEGWVAYMLDQTEALALSLSMHCLHASVCHATTLLLVMATCS